MNPVSGSSRLGPVTSVAVEHPGFQSTRTTYTEPCVETAGRPFRHILLSTQAKWAFRKPLHLDHHEKGNLTANRLGPKYGGELPDRVV